MSVAIWRVEGAGLKRGGCDGETEDLLLVGVKCTQLGVHGGEEVFGVEGHGRGKGIRADWDGTVGRVWGYESRERRWWADNVA